jgi:hypothetical protein
LFPVALRICSYQDVVGERRRLAELAAPASPPCEARGLVAWKLAQVPPGAVTFAGTV